MTLHEAALSSEQAVEQVIVPRKLHFSIRDLTGEFGVTARTLRFYEEKGLLAPSRSGQERLYSRRDRARLKLVLMGRNVGFSLEDISAMLDLYDLGDGQATQLRVALLRFEEKLAELDRKRRDLDQAHAELTHACDVVRARLGRESRAGTGGLARHSLQDL